MQTPWILAALLSSQAAFALDVGETSPKLEFAGEDLSGKVVLVNFWATWCAPCKKELPLLDALHQRIVDDGALVLAINVDTRSRIAEATAKHLDFTAPVLYDPTGTVARPFAPEAMPTTYLLDGDGVVHKVIVGEIDEQGIIALEAEIRTLLASES